MNWFTKRAATPECKWQTGYLGWLCGVVIFCCSSLVFADSLDETGVHDELAWVDPHTKPVEDDVLSLINGKGSEKMELNDGGKLAVILWDERGNTNRRGTNHDEDMRQVVNFTVIRR